MRTESQNLSIKRIIILVLTLALVISIGGIGYMIFSSWVFSSEHMTEKMADELNNRIFSRITSFMHTPNHVNAENHLIVENGILDLSDDLLRDRYFVGVLNSQHNEIYSFSYGTANGEYYGARRNEDGIVEIMRNNAATAGNSWYYSVKDDYTAGELIIRAGAFDPRTRAWYKAALEAGGPTFSPVYKHFIMDDLTVSAAWPVYNSIGELQGVMGTHMLLSDIGTFLLDSVIDHEGLALIYEKDSGLLIANSMGIDTHTILEDGTLHRFGVSELGNFDIRRAYDRYSTTNASSFFIKGERGKLYIDVQEFKSEGIDWVVVSAIPEALYMTDIINSIHYTLPVLALVILLSIGLFSIIAGRLMKPVRGLLQVSAALASGDLSKRAVVARKDEIGIISESLNKVADEMQALVGNLEKKVRERTEELHRTNKALVENQNRLQLILNSTAEAIYGIDTNGICTFSNASCVMLLGYNNAQELLGRNMHQVIHHSRRNGEYFPIEECRIHQAINEGKGFIADDEVFWKADGTPFDVEYRAYPQISDGKVVGGVITFMDITDRKKREEEVRYLHCHDILTGLHNRRCFEENNAKIDVPDSYPLTVVFADINGLKMTNDIFGHTAGDKLIKKSAEILTQSCREKDVIARVGGDEFIILLPRTDAVAAQKIMGRIKRGFLDARVAAIKCSISLGCDTKTSAEQSLEEVMANAENAMYKDKSINRGATNREIIDTIVDALHSKCPREKRHSIAVSVLCRQMGVALNLTELENNKLQRAGYLHDIGKITLDDTLLSKESLLAEELERMQQHSVVGYRILNLFDDTLDLSEYVYSHHERWDGEGYPRGLKGEQIPLIARIISVVETYDRVLMRCGESVEALKAIKEAAGTQFDPEIARLFVQMIEDSVEDGRPIEANMFV